MEVVVHVVSAPHAQFVIGVNCSSGKTKAPEHGAGKEAKVDSPI